MVSIYIDPTSLPHDWGGAIQLIFLAAVYGKLLMVSADLIGDGSELLLLVPSLAGVVGSCVVPALGAVPDAAMVLFSGLGANPQEELNVGIGALAGSTIMLLTVPWALSVLGGRVSLDERGQPTYKKPPNAGKDWQKLRPEDAWQLFKCGCTVTDEIRRYTRIMIFTAVGYVIIQGAGFAYDKESDEGYVARKEFAFALIGLLVCIFELGAYLRYQYQVSNADAARADRREEVAIKTIAQGQVSLLGVLLPVFMESEALTDEEIKRRTEPLVHPFFHHYDLDKSGTIDAMELSALFKDLGETLTADQIKGIFERADKEHKGALGMEEFLTMLCEFMRSRLKAMKAREAGVAYFRTGSRGHTSAQAEGGGEMEMSATTGGGGGGSKLLAAAGDDDEEAMAGVVPGGGDEQHEEREGSEGGEEEEEEVPDDLKHLSYEDQQRRIKMRSAYMLTVGTIMCMVFSDPMVDVLNEMGRRSGIPSFYVAFVLAPLISNYTELSASYNYATKKTTKTMTVSLSIHPGAATMNNCLCLGVFLFLCLARHLAWRFSAETIAIILVEVLVFCMSLKKVHTLFDACVILSFYPLSLLLVYIMEANGMD